MIPDRLMIVVERARLGASPEASVLAACQGGARWLCVREPHMDARELLAWVARVRRIAEKFGAQVFVNGRADLARASHADGLHLPERELSPRDARLTLGFHAPIGVSVHGLEAAHRARDEGASYLVFGPVFSTPTHPGTPGQGLNALAEIAAQCALPVHAIGGITPERASLCLAAGAHGVAVISAVWDAPDASAIANNVRALRLALGEEPPASHHVSQIGGVASPHGLAAILKRDS